MTDEELKDLVAENSRAIRENNSAIGELREVTAETSRIVAENSRAIRENNVAIRELREETREEILATRREMDRQFTGVHRQLSVIHGELGAFGNSLGLYTESMFRPSLERLLRERFGMTEIAAPEYMELDGETYELDMVGHAGDQVDEVYVVEVKTQLRLDGMKQLLAHLRRFPRAFPEHRGKKLFGILAAVSIPEGLRPLALKQGLYLATFADELVELSMPDDFEPRPFGLRSLRS